MPSHDHGSQRRIPAPKVEAKYLYTNKAGKPSLQSQMGLQDDRSQLEAMTAATREAALRHFDLRPSTYREQRPEVLRTVKDLVAKECAVLNRYEDGWPVSRYIQIYLKNLHVKKGQISARRPASKSAGPRYREVAKSQLASASKATRPGPSRDSAGFMQRQATEEASRGRAQGRQGSLVGAKRDEEHNSSHVSASTLTPLSSANRLASREASPEVEYYNPLGPKARSRTIVTSFLASLRIPGPDSIRIAELFDMMGIQTQDYLELFATMETRDEWLQELVAGGELTPIQMRLLREGLDRVKRYV
ncbi:hypothetical protein OH76DRAFT_1481948 [Lentinus brumalis]|uniref:Uncharacterized protein n=1 Tax=Lentinus brumalis TaxID=2498619 RepID=A0A371DEB5_9APHY|nr:hypothetical protein OH76DRAFT_1481948 [Polyporus brumalis]